MKKTQRVGNAIKARREAIGLTQGELARRVGVTSSQIAYVEAGRRRPSFSLLFHLSRNLNLDRKKLFLLAYPDAASLIAPSRMPAIEKPEAVWRRFAAVASRYSVTPAELTILRQISHLGNISSPSSYLWILN